VSNLPKPKDELNELFSDSSSSPKISVAEFSDDEKRNSRDKRDTSYKRDNRGSTANKNVSRKRDNNNSSSNKRSSINTSDNDQFKRIKDIDIPKKKRPDNVGNSGGRNAPQVSQFGQIIHNRPINNIPTNNPIIIPTNQMNLATNVPTNVQNLQLNPALLQKLLEEASKNPGSVNFGNLNIQNIQQMLANPQIQQMLRQHQQRPVERTEREHSRITQPPKQQSSTILNEITNFIENNSNRGLNENLPLFQSISLFFSQYMPNQLTQLDLKSPLDLLKIKDFNERDSYRRYLKSSIEGLYSNIQNSCSICGFRTGLSYKFKEHLDIHFHINYVKRNSQKKVLYRKESMSRNSWINTTSCTYNGVVNTNSTINSVLYYLNDTEHVLNNGSNNKTTESQQENERFLYPVKKSVLVKCAYCNEEFRKRYINKFHYWFYLNVVKIDDTEQLVHENCLEEYVASPGYEEYLTKKRFR
jgi:hypothetical protein